MSLASQGFAHSKLWRFESSLGRFARTDATIIHRISILSTPHVLCGLCLVCWFTMVSSCLWRASLQVCRSQDFLLRDDGPPSGCASGSGLLIIVVLCFLHVCLSCPPTFEHCHFVSHQRVFFIWTCRCDSTFHGSGKNAHRSV